MSEQKGKLIKRLRILRGQIEAIEKMIDKGDDCEKMLTQIKAVRSGLLSCTREIIQNKYCSCKKGQVCSKDVEEILELLARY